MPSDESIDVYGHSSVGRVRENNQDQYLIADLSKDKMVELTSLAHQFDAPYVPGSWGKVLIVADGMGGHADGQRASSLVVQTITEQALVLLPEFAKLENQENLGENKEFESRLKAAAEACHKAVLDDVEDAPERRGMGTTLTLAFVVWPQLFILHAGDSRAYWLRDGKLAQVTKDHTLAQRMVEMGAMKPEDAESSAFGNILWNAIVADDNSKLQSDFYKLTLQKGDRLLLCSDGLTKHVSDKRIAEVLQEATSSEEACKALVDDANEGGGTDNTTVVVARF